MSSLNHELVTAARHELGRPFRHHIKPVNFCDFGRFTVDQCMQQGMDSEGGFDCVGLVIASICRLNGTSVRDWPREYRHKLHEFEVDKEPEFGDVLLIESNSIRTGRPYGTHMGIYIEPSVVLHANGKSGFVDEGLVAGIITDIKVADVSALCELALRQGQDDGYTS
ncbi:MAG: NlpC/P60 family protein [Candidatus Saccharibacteria bacterium]